MFELTHAITHKQCISNALYLGTLALIPRRAQWLTGLKQDPLDKRACHVAQHAGNGVVLMCQDPIGMQFLYHSTKT